MGLVALRCSLPKLPLAQMTFPGTGGFVALSELNRDRQKVHNDGDYNRFSLFVKSDIETDVDDLSILHIVFFAFKAQGSLLSRFGH